MRSHIDLPAADRPGACCRSTRIAPLTYGCRRRRARRPMCRYQPAAICSATAARRLVAPAGDLTMWGDATIWMTSRGSVGLSCRAAATRPTYRSSTHSVIRTYMFTPSDRRRRKAPPSGRGDGALHGAIMGKPDVRSADHPSGWISGRGRGASWLCLPFRAERPDAACRALSE
jgi:hypothetical protein